VAAVPNGLSLTPLRIIIIIKRPIFTLSPYLSPSLLNGLFLSDFPTEKLICIYHIFHVYAVPYSVGPWVLRIKSGLLASSLHKAKVNIFVNTSDSIKWHKIRCSFDAFLMKSSKNVSTSFSLSRSLSPHITNREPPKRFSRNFVFGHCATISRHTRTVIWLRSENNECFTRSQRARLSASRV
jgi:hypothetical protein